MKFPKLFLAALLALIVGVTGVVVCAVPHYGPEKIVYDYVDAVEKGDADAITACYATSQSGVMDSVVNELAGAVSANLAQYMLNVSTDATVESLKVLGCSVEESEETLNGYNVVALIEGEYVDAEGAEQTTVVACDFYVVKTQKGYKIYD